MHVMCAAAKKGTGRMGMMLSAITAANIFILKTSEIKILKEDAGQHT